MKHKRILAMLLAVASCLSLAVSASAASTARKATDFKDFDRNAWYADAVSAAVDNGLLYGKSSTIIDPNGDMTRAEMAAIINRSAATKRRTFHSTKTFPRVSGTTRTLLSPSRWVLITGAVLPQWHQIRLSRGKKP